MRSFALLIFALLTVVTAWTPIKTFDFSSIDKVRNEWTIQEWAPGLVNNEREHYTDDGRTVTTENGRLVINAYAQSRQPALTADHDIEGNDLTSVNNQKIENCPDLCRANAACVAFVYNSYKSGTCWLKTRFGPKVAKSGAIVGVMMDTRSARLESKTTFSPLRAKNGLLRVEYTAKVDTPMGAWPALWMLGREGVYGGWPQEGEIDLMEWVYQLQNDIKSSLHWKSGNDFSTDFTGTMMSSVNSQFITYGVEYGNTQNPYIQFYIRTPNGIFSKTRNGTRATYQDWQTSWNPNPPCSQSNAPCTKMAPFDNDMTLIMNIAVGGDWGGCCGVNSYNAFNGAGVKMTVESVVVYEN